MVYFVAVVTLISLWVPGSGAAFWYCYCQDIGYCWLWFGNVRPLRRTFPVFVYIRKRSGRLKVRCSNISNCITSLTFFSGIPWCCAARMIRDTGADYKKAIVAVAIAGGVGATVAGAGLLAYRLWRRSRSVPETKSDRPSAPLHTVSRRRTMLGYLDLSRLTYLSRLVTNFLL